MALCRSSFLQSKICAQKISEQQLELDFVGMLSSELCCKLTIDLIKLIIYFREQIPIPLAEMEVALKAKNEGVHPTSTLRQRTQQEKALRLLSTFKTLYDYLEKVFSNIRENGLKEIAILLGATPLTPKEVHIIQIPEILWTQRELNEIGFVANVINQRRCFLQAFRTLSMCPTETGFQDGHLPITNITVLLKMRRTVRTDWFLPKVPYEIPRRGRRVVYTVSYTDEQSVKTRQNATSCELPYNPEVKLNADGDAFKQYNFEQQPFPIFRDERNSMDLLVCKGSSSPEKGNITVVEENQLAGGCEQVHREVQFDLGQLSLEGVHSLQNPSEELIWFQMPEVLKGLSVI